MFAGFTTIRSIVYVGIVLIAAFAVTGAISSSYERERQSLGEQHYDQGQGLQRQGEVEAAVDQYREALLFSPDNRDYRLSLATALLDIGHLDEAQAHLQQLAQEDPTNGRINLALAQVALKRNKIGDAIDSYQRAVYEYWPPQAIPERRRARWQLVTLLHAAGRRNDEIAELLQLYSSSPADPTERARIGFLLARAGALSEAAQIFHNLEVNYPQNILGHRGLGDVRFASGDYVAARHEYQHALRLSPKDHDVQSALALTNAVIDLDPVLPDISSAEQLRRSQLLLSRIVSELNGCLLQKAPAPVAQLQLDDARNLLTPSHPVEDDYALTLQRAAVQLWQNRGAFCPASVSPNRAIDLAVGRISNE